MQVFKFGGASVKDAPAIRNLKDILSQHLEAPKVVVISAMDKTTNELELLLKEVWEGKNPQEQLDKIGRFHRQVAEDLLGEPCARFEQFFTSLSLHLENFEEPNYQKAYDSVVSYGELFSTSIIGAYLESDLPISWLDARDVMRTDSFHTEASLDWIVTHERVSKIIRPKLKEGLSVITQGFIGSSYDGATTTLGREGSDFTGAVFAYCLDAEQMTVWKDVPGILNADPKLMQDPLMYNHLSYREVTEMTYYGAKVIHPKTLTPLAQRNIPLHVRSFIQPDVVGTWITGQKSSQTHPTFVFQQNQILIKAAVKDHSFMNEKRLGSILNVLDHLNVKINLMQVSALTFSFCMDYKPYKVERIEEFLAKDFLLSSEKPLQLATIKNYTEEAMNQLPEMRDKLLEQKTPITYQVLYK